MIYVIAYDIADDSVRVDIARVLEGYGHRVQESVFECRLEARDLKDLCGRLQRTLNNQPIGHVRMYRICERCEAASLIIGNSEPAGQEDCYIF